MSVFQIIKGALYSTINYNGDVMEQRIELACKNCVLAHKDGVYIGWCNGEKGGCGCKLDFKTRLREQKCPKNIWANEWVKLDRLEELNKEMNFKK